MRNSPKAISLSSRQLPFSSLIAYFRFHHSEWPPDAGAVRREHHRRESPRSGLPERDPILALQLAGHHTRIERLEPAEQERHCPKAEPGGDRPAHLRSAGLVEGEPSSIGRFCCQFEPA